MAKDKPRKGSMKKILLAIFLLLMAIGIYIYAFRHDIMKYSIDKLIQNNLPPYAAVENIHFDFAQGIITIKGLAIKNPELFQDKNMYLAYISDITCKYKLQGKTILEGIEVTSIAANRATINIERLRNGKLNLNEMSNMMDPRPDKNGGEPHISNVPGPANEARAEISPGKLIKLCNSIIITDSEVIFTDHMYSGHTIAINDVSSTVVLNMDANYSQVLELRSDGSGSVNNNSSERIEWIVRWEPSAPQLTMSNRLELTNVNVTVFEPYYEKYSPVNIETARCSGILVFDFDNGILGSNNILKFKNLKFKVKSINQNASPWQANVEDIIRYLETSDGDIIFDFKIKGPMNDLKFYPGSKLTQALKQLAINKFTNMLTAGQANTVGSVANAGETQAENVLETIKGLLK